jgi:two-component system sensor histidine kinase QseC
VLTSIRQRLLFSLLASIIVVGGFTIALSYIDARHEIQELFDAQLAESARIIQSQVLYLLQHDEDHGLRGKLEDNPLIPEETSYKRHDRDDDEDNDDEKKAYGIGHEYERKIAFQLRDRSGAILLRSASAPLLPLSARTIDTLPAGYSDESIGNETWRVFSLWDASHSYLVKVGEQYAVRNELAGKISRRLIQGSVIALPLLTILIWYGIGRGLAPLRKVAVEVARRDPRHLEPLDIGPVPDEIKPLATALNDLLQRLAEALEKERRFTDDAAHELRTPLAALKTQAQVAIRATNASERERALQQIVHGVDRATHLLDQLLTLARLQHKTEQLQLEPVDLHRLVAGLIADLAPRAMAREIELELKGPQDIVLDSHPVSLSILVRNLLANAINYTPPGGRIELELQPRADAVIIAIRDTGPGIDPDLLERVFDRFYRVSGSDAEGCGLGLAIARQSAELLGATLHLRNRQDQPGLVAEVCLPRMRDEGRGTRDEGQGTRDE